MNILKNGLLSLLSTLMIASSLLFSCKKDDDLPKYENVIDSYIKLNKIVAKDFKIDGPSTALIYPFNHGLEEYSFECTLTNISDAHEIFIGKGNGGIQLVNRVISITDNNANIVFDGVSFSGSNLKVRIDKNIDSISYAINGKHFVSFYTRTQHRAVLLRGEPTVAGISGTFTVKSISFNTWRNADYFIIGDSLVEGGALLENRFDIKNKWTSLLSRNLSDIVFAIDGLGGEALTNESANRVIEEINAINPKYVIIQFGTNNMSYTEYIDGINHIRNNVNANIYISTCVIRPTPPYVDNNIKINEWILGQANSIDFQSILYMDGGFVKDYFFADTFHPNRSGNIMMESIVRELVLSN